MVFKSKPRCANSRFKIRFTLALGVIAQAAFLPGCGPTGDGKAQAASSGKSPSPAVQQQLPPEVGQWVQMVRRECTANGGQFGGISNFVLPGDFNGDGRPDYVLQWSGAQCPDPHGGAGEAFAWGNAGPDNDFLLSQAAGGYRLYEGFHAELGEGDVVRQGDRDIIVINGRWAQPGGEVRKVIHGWTGQSIDVIERQDARGQRVDERGYPLQASGRSPVSDAAFPPIPQGFYAIGSTCEEAAREDAYVYFTNSRWQWSDGGPSIRSIESLGSGNWRLRFEEGDSTTLRVTGPTTFIENGRPFQHCADSSVPASMRPAYAGNG